MPTDTTMDLATPAASLSPVLGRYFERTWSHGVGHRLYDTSGEAYLDFANGIAVTALGLAHLAQPGDVGQRLVEVLDVLPEHLDVLPALSQAKATANHRPTAVWGSHW